MGSKGSQTQSQQGTSTYTANPAVQNAGYQALNMAQSAASQPFSLGAAPVAGFSPDQQQAFQQYRDAQGMAQPYYNQARGLFDQSAQSITGGDINRYIDPYSSYVLGNLKEQQGQQMNDLTGRLTQAAGGVGADRIAVGQGELARQQGLATGQTLSGIYGNALAAAQADKARQSGAAYGIGNLGGAAQNAALQGTGALFGAGQQQQNLQQQQLNSQYQNQLAKLAYPYQNAQYLAGITGNLAGAMGGTTASGTNGVSTPPQPSIYSQVAGLGTGLVGLGGATGAFGNNGWLTGSSPSYGGGNFFSGDAYGGSGSNPLPGLSASDYGTGYADGGGVGGDSSWMGANSYIPMAEMRPSEVHQPQLPAMQSAKSDSGGGFGDILKTAAQIIPMFLARGGAAYADGGETDGSPDFDERFAPVAASPFRHVDPVSFGNRFSPAEESPLAIQKPTPFASRFAPATENPLKSYDPTVINPDQPYRMPDQKAVQEWRDSVSQDQTNPNMKPPLVAKEEEDDTGSPFGYNANAAQQTADANRKGMINTTFDVPYPKATSDESTEFARSPWLALMNAGFGMMAGTSPFAGVNIGSGLQQGVKTLEKQRTEAREEEGVNQRAKQLAQQAQQHLDQYTKLTPAQAATIENQKAVLNQHKEQLEVAGWQKGNENILTGDTTYFNPRTGESGILRRDGTWEPKGKAAPGATPAGAQPAPPAVVPEPEKAPSQPPPYGVKELGKNLEPSSANIPFMGKGSPMATAANKDLQTEIARISKSSAMLAPMKQDLASMKNSMEIITRDADKDGFLQQLALQPGANFGDRLELAKKANAIKQAAGLPPPFNPEKIAAAENINKIQNRMGMTFASQISPREAFSGQKIGIESSPGLTNTVQGFHKLIAGFEAAAENATDENKFFQEYLRKNGTSLGWRQDFEAKNPPERYLVKAVISHLPKYNQEHLAEDVEALRKDPSEKNVALFNKHYSNTASYFLTGKY